MRTKRPIPGHPANGQDPGAANGFGEAHGNDARGTSPGADHDPAERAGRDALGTVLADLEGVFDDLDCLAGAMAGLGAASLDDLARLAAPICDLLEARRGLVAGAGLITAPDVLRDAPRWLEWWWTPGAGAPQQLQINLDPAAPDFYDYTTAEWYATPRRTGARSVAGPYVDFACTGEYTVTLSTPVVRGGEFLGLAAADILAATLEERVLPALLTVGRPVALTSAHGRVIASNSPHFAPGLRVELAQHASAPAVTSDRPRSTAGATADADAADTNTDTDRGNTGSPLRSWLLVDVAADEPA